MRGLCADARHPEDPEGVHSAAVCFQTRQPGQFSEGILPEAREGKKTFTAIMCYSPHTGIR